MQSHHFAGPLEIPGWHRPSGKLAAQACMREQVARVPGSPVRVEIGWRCSRSETLHAWADRDGDHVLLEPLVIANAGVAADRQYIDEAVLNHDLHADIGISLEERRDDGWQYDPRGARRHVEFERARRLVSEPVQNVHRRFHLAEQWRQLFDETKPRFRRGYPACGPVEQAQLKLRLDATH